MEWFLAMLPAFILVALLSAAEMLVRPARADWWRNLQAWLLNTLGAMAAIPLLITLGGPALVQGADLPVWAALLGYLVVRDGLEFLFHRAQHTVPWLWSMHSLHHSDPDMSALTSGRHFWAEPIIKAMTIWPLTALIIAPTPLILGLFNLFSLWNFVVHARLPFGFGRFSWLLNSPAYHRRHHSILPEHYNSNYAALLPIFDVAFGSYNRPEGWPPTGLDTRPGSLRDLVAWPVRQGQENRQQQALPQA